MSDFINNLPPSMREALEQQPEMSDDYKTKLIDRMMRERPEDEDGFSKAQEEKETASLTVGVNQMLTIDLESLMPFNDKMSRGECYGKGMYDFAVTVKRMADSAKKAKEAQSYMYWGAILDRLIDDLDHLTYGVLIQKIQK